MVEQGPCKAQVVGSNPTGGLNTKGGYVELILGWVKLILIVGALIGSLSVCLYLIGEQMNSEAFSMEQARGQALTEHRIEKYNQEVKREKQRLQEMLW